MNKLFALHNDAIRQRAKQAIDEAAPGMMVKISEPVRNLDQNARFHAICNDISRAGVQWMGKTRSPEAWKVLLVSGHAVATKEEIDIVPGIEGEFVNLRESTALMSKRRSASLIDYATAFAITHGVELYDEATC